MTEDKPLKPPEKTAFEVASPWIGAAAFVVCMYYLLERNQEIPWYVFAICGALMGLAKAAAHFKGMKP
ncbi:hypothetical protein [uncultured Paraglaciecola sp.]|uniref:hypothetical protein n=1 Tax=uncultured Paraglaciecola sp. TaxID=1765024 RepID=UPI0026059B2E|nr:hypothetical protein [uncultured Paraglaciecola sp.]